MHPPEPPAPPADGSLTLHTTLLSDLVVPGGAARAAELEALSARAAVYATRARGPGTRRTYRSAWQGYETWCRTLGREPLAGDPDTLAIYAVACADRGLTVSSLRVHLAAIQVVEDEYMIAEEIATELSNAGADVLGPVSRIVSALRLIAAGSRIDGALVDVNLGREAVWPVVDALLARGVSLVLATGYDAGAILTTYAPAALRKAGQWPGARPRAHQSARRCSSQRSEAYGSP